MNIMNINVYSNAIKNKFSFYYELFFSVEQKREIEFYENHEKETGGKNNMMIHVQVCQKKYL